MVGAHMGPDLVLAHELADAADAISMARFRAGDLQVSTKPDKTPVTEADVAVETEIRVRLAAARPRDAIARRRARLVRQGPAGDGSSTRSTARATTPAASRSGRR